MHVADYVLKIAEKYGSEVNVVHVISIEQYP
jgi:hypothetical protein